MQPMPRPTPPVRVRAAPGGLFSRPGVRLLIAVLPGGLMSAGLLAGGHHAGAATPAESNAARSVFTMLNAERAANRLPALGWSDALVASAHRHNLSMAAANSMQHVLPGEVSVGQRI